MNESTKEMAPMKEPGSASMETQKAMRERLYGPFAAEMAEGGFFYDRTVEKVAFVYLAGCYPSHLRKDSAAILRRLATLDPEDSAVGTGPFKVRLDAFRDLHLDAHPMIVKAREFLDRGYRVQFSRGYRERRNYWRVFLYRPGPLGEPLEPVTVHADGAVRDGW